MSNKPIIIVAGEPYSVFLEILFKSIKKNIFTKPIILIVSQELFTGQMKALNYNIDFNIIDEKKISFKILSKTKINIINVDLTFKNIFDKISNNSKNYIEKSFMIALNLIKKNECAGIINGPISKKHFLAGKYLGITEYLASKMNKKNKVAMLIFNKNLSVSPITTHIPLKNVHKELSKKKIINHVKLIKEFYKKRYKRNPIIAITGLNPHCESNYKSSEEDLIIRPAIKYLNTMNYTVNGPFAADTIFMKDQSKKYDVIIGMYHDQVLTPAKTLFGFESINITLGLPFVRISPDHGPNTAMLGKNLSNPESLIQALKFLDN
jgi:4-hydroxythreonine-4-phosphate dehydrogenase